MFYMFCYFDAISTSDKQIDATLTYTNVENLLDPEEEWLPWKMWPIQNVY